MSTIADRTLPVGAGVAIPGIAAVVSIVGAAANATLIFDDTYLVDLLLLPRPRGHQGISALRIVQDLSLRVVGALRHARLALCRGDRGLASRHRLGDLLPPPPAAYRGVAGRGSRLGVGPVTVRQHQLLPSLRI